MARRQVPDYQKPIGPFGGAYLLLALGFLVGPFLPLLIQSLAFNWVWPDLLPSEWWFTARQRARLPQGWDYVVSPYSRVGEALLNTVSIGLATSMLCLAICLPAARVLGRHDFGGKRLLELYLALPLILPEAVIGIALSMMFIRLGLAGTHAGIVLVHLIPTMPYVMRMLVAGFQGLDREVEEQARVLGASNWQVTRLITLPMILPTAMAAMLFAFLVSTNLFLLTFLMGQGKVVTLPTLLFSKLSGGALDPTAAGIALVAAMPGVAVLLLLDRFAGPSPSRDHASQVTAPVVERISVRPNRRTQSSA
ncbi:MAG: ABC transporter permease [Geminicoccaceae bacterium]